MDFKVESFVAKSNFDDGGVTPLNERDPGTGCGGCAACCIFCCSDGN